MKRNLYVKSSLRKQLPSCTISHQNWTSPVWTCLKRQKHPHQTCSTKTIPMSVI